MAIQKANANASNFHMPEIFENLHIKPLTRLFPSSTSGSAFETSNLMKNVASKRAHIVGGPKLNLLTPGST